MAERVLADCDIVLDLLAKREPFYAAAARVFGLAETKKIELLVSPVAMANIFYLLRKALGGPDAISALRKLRLITRVAPMDAREVDLALASGFADFEDALQYYAALRSQARVLLTRNARDYSGRELVVMSCEEYLAARGA
jgi:predicted nucleic acid-binding protein